MGEKVSAEGQQCPGLGDGCGIDSHPVSLHVGPQVSFPRLRNRRVNRMSPWGRTRKRALFSGRSEGRTSSYNILQREPGTSCLILFKSICDSILSFFFKRCLATRIFFTTYCSQNKWTHAEGGMCAKGNGRI